MEKIEKAVQWAISIANDSSHGYDQGNRWGTDYDCSSLVISAWEAAGVPVKSFGASYTGNMRNAFLASGHFKDVTSEIDLQTGQNLARGDILLNEVNHTAMYIGSGKIVQAGGNEFGGIVGGQPGDQNGHEIQTMQYFNFPWNVILRFSGNDRNVGTSEGENASQYTVQPGDTLWGISEKLLGSGMKYKELMRINHLENDVLKVGQVLKISESEESCEIELKILKNGDKGKTVESMQYLIYARGYQLVKYGMDGEFGEETEEALKEYQSDHGLTSDGICGVDTWNSLLK